MGGSTGKLTLRDRGTSIWHKSLGAASAHRNHSLNTGGGHPCIGCPPQERNRRIPSKVAHTRDKGFLRPGFVVTTDTLAQSRRPPVEFGSGFVGCSLYSLRGLYHLGRGGCGKIALWPTLSKVDQKRGRVRTFRGIIDRSGLT